MRGRKFRSDVLVTLVFAVLKAVAVVWSIRLAESLYPAFLLGVYLLSRRVAATLPALTALGVSNTLQRYIPLGNNDPLVNTSLLSASLILIVIVNSLVILVFALFGNASVSLLFPNSGGYGGIAYLAMWTVAQCALIALHFVVIGALVGQRRMFAANLLDLLVVGGWQIAAFWYYGRGATPVLVTRFQTLAMVATTVPAFAFMISSEARRAGRWLLMPARQTWAAFLTYGTTRGAVTFLDALLVTQGPWLLRNQPQAIGYLIVALTIPRLAGTALSSVNGVTSVAVAGLLGRRDHHAVRVGVNLAIGLVASSALLGAAVLAPFMDRILSAWLSTPSAIASVSSLAPYLLMALPAVGLFHGLKGVVDVQEMFPHNLVNLLLANFAMWVIFRAVETIMPPVVAVVIAFALAHVILAVATLRALHRWLMAFQYFAVWRLIAVALGAWLLCNAMAQATSGQSAAVALPVALATMAVAFVGAMAVLAFASKGMFPADLFSLIAHGNLPVELAPTERAHA